MAERRLAQRSRTRLRPGKILGEDGRFVADCAILDRSASGARIRLLDHADVPDSFRLLDEGQALSLAAHAVWQREGEAGLQLAGPAERLDRKRFLDAAGPFYAVR